MMIACNTTLHTNIIKVTVVWMFLRQNKLLLVADPFTPNLTKNIKNGIKCGIFLSLTNWKKWMFNQLHKVHKHYVGLMGKFAHPTYEVKHKVGGNLCQRLSYSAAHTML